MPTPQVQNDPIYQLPFLYINGMIVSNDATTPNTKLDISAGQCRDSNDVMDIALGASNPNIEGGIVAAPLVLDFSVNGANGLDTGSIGASTLYAIYMIADSRYYQPVACIATLASNSNPLVPLGYDSLRLIGYWRTDGSSHLLAGYIANAVGGSRQFIYDAPIAVVTGGVATTYAAGLTSLLGFVPNVNNTMIMLQCALTPNAASDTLKLQGGASTGDAYTFTGQVAAVVLDCDATVLAQTVSSAPKFAYKLSTASAAVTISLQGYSFSI